MPNSFKAISFDTSTFFAYIKLAKKFIPAKNICRT